MREKVGYYKMLDHLHHLESKCGEGVLSKPLKEVVEIVRKNHCEDDYKAIQAFGERSRAYYVSPEMLGAVRFFINRGFFIDEIADKVGDLDRADVERIMKTYPEDRKLYQSKRYLRQRRQRQRKNEHRKQVGKKISLIRKALGLDQTHFGRRVGLASTSARQVVVNWETGVYLPTKENLETIAGLGNTTVEELLETE